MAKRAGLDQREAAAKLAIAGVYGARVEPARMIAALDRPDTSHASPLEVDFR